MPPNEPASRPAAAPASPSPPWGLLAVGVALGLVVGLFVADRFRTPPPATSPPTPASVPAGVQTGLSAAQADRLIQALEGFDAAARRLGDALAAPPAPPADVPPSPAPGALVPGLPPEGVPLVKVWFGRRLRAELAELELVAANPSATLGNAPSPERVAAAKADWKAQGEGLLTGLDSLAAVGTELELARWLDETGRGATFPKPWQFRALAEELRAAPR